jgi:hypothetical protein
MQTERALPGFNSLIDAIAAPRLPGPAAGHLLPLRWRAPPGRRCAPRSPAAAYNEPSIGTPVKTYLRVGELEREQVELESKSIARIVDVDEIGRGRVDLGNAQEPL